MSRELRPFQSCCRSLRFAPLWGWLLVMAAGGNWRWPLVGMLAFSTVFAAPFFVLALMPQWIARLPRSGGWLNSVKVMMAFLEIAAALKFISNVDLVWGWGFFTRDVVQAIAAHNALCDQIHLPVQCGSNAVLEP